MFVKYLQFSSISHFVQYDSIQSKERLLRLPKNALPHHQLDFSGYLWYTGRDECVYESVALLHRISSLFESRLQTMQSSPDSSWYCCMPGYYIYFVSHINITKGWVQRCHVVREW